MSAQQATQDGKRVRIGFGQDPGQAGKAAYLDEVSREAQSLIDAGYLLPEDSERILAQSARRWDLLASAPESAAAQ